MAKKKTYVYALDLSLNSPGICIFTNDGRFVKSLTVDTHAEENTPSKLKLIGDTFLSLIEKYTPKVIVIENGFSRYNTSTQQLYRCHGVANYIFWNYEQVYIPPSKVKKVITGKGNASKEEVRQAIIKNNKHLNFGSMDESDAYALAITYFKEVGGKK